MKMLLRVAALLLALTALAFAQQAEVTQQSPISRVWQSAVAVPVTGTTTETALGTVTIPANAIGANGRVRVTGLWSYTNSANSKTLRVRYSSISGTICITVAPTTTASARISVEIANRNAANSQICNNYEAQGGFGAATTAVVTAAVDTTADTTVVLTGQLSNTGETITLESYVIELIPGP